MHVTASPDRTPDPPLSEPLIRPEIEAGPEDEFSSRSLGDLSDDPSGVQSLRPQRSKNIRLTLAFSFVAFAGRSLWNQSVLPAFVFLLQNDNPEAVGFLTAVTGMSQLVTSFPSGVLADRHRRDTMLRVASVVGLVAIVATSVASWTETYWALGAALAVWGVFWGIANTSIGALFADSMEDGDRSYYFTKRGILRNYGNTAGPIVSLIMFAILGDKWEVKDCALVMFVGQVLCLPSVFLLCFLSDDYMVGSDQDDTSEMIPDEEASSQRDTSSVHSSDEHQSDERLFQFCSWFSHLKRRRGCFFVSKHRIVPVCVSLADIMSGLASGMSIRYFPIFFLENLKLNPVTVQVLNIMSPLGQASLSKVAQRAAQRFGRCQIVVVTKWTGVTLMLGMIASHNCELPNVITLILYLLRTIFMNSTAALTKSVLMDAVPRNERGKWTSLESVNMFSWSGSAAIGGLLVKWNGIIFNFYITAFLQFLATLPLIRIFTLVADERSA